MAWMNQNPSDRLSNTRGKGRETMSDVRTVKVALLGLGTVGTGVYKLIKRQSKEMENKIGAKLEIASILVHNMKKIRDGVDQSLLTDNWKEIAENEEISIVIEVMGGIEPARTMILEALNAGKNVVTANKDLVAEYGRELFQAAEKNHRDFMFEAAVAGGIPIIRPLKQCLAGNNITEVVGIVNGTTNYILTKMFEKDMEFEDALERATELGYAEADPTADIEGYDAGRKVAIMASIAFHSRVVFQDVKIEGITKITSKDIQCAKNFGCVIKLLGVARNTPEGIEAAVHPMLIENDHPLAAVRGAFNAVFVHGDAVGDAMFYGKGAGELPTASAIMGDVIDVARNIAYQCNGRISCTCYNELPIRLAGESENKYFLRMNVVDRPGVLAQIAQVFGSNEVSISKVTQKAESRKCAELVIITDVVKESNMAKSMEILKDMPIIKEVNSMIRVYA